MPVIEVDRLAKHFTYYEKELGLKNSLKNLFRRRKLVKEAVAGISFAIEEGEIVGFLGPNGAGKTTTLKMLSGILFPSSGRATVLGYVPWERKKGFKMQFSIVMGQKNQLWWDLPANESLYLNKCIYEIPDREYFSILDELSELLEVRQLLKVQVRRLSLGERMKLELIAALLHRPKVILLDEPTIGLDLVSQQKIRNFLKYYNQQMKTTIILTSHYLVDIEELCKRTIVINQGQIVYDGELTGINGLFSEQKIVRLQFGEEIGRERLAGFGALKAFDGVSATLAVERGQLKKNSALMLEHLPVIDFNIEDVPLEEGIAALYQR
ncbi:ABC-2 type transport system ATP-binding protein [Hydrogenispora ethanolica]|uniref:ABC-2 type transport system ATP-binding protein n=1 Tax=Hydrogenispora ethanolica TaxID=1082276 RepID=A0A4R1S6W1_HYDET|nr:ATP-binding cassette domain-containing protein [Hydrogenispora ethanolica]TCL75113.1 ABC-2 type transport system ATP-binding protein [Hydrogenispora ethanolica]